MDFEISFISMRALSECLVFIVGISGPKISPKTNA